MKSWEKEKKKEKEIESFEEQRKKVYKTLSPKTKIKRSKIWRLVHLINKGYWGGFANELPWKKRERKKEKKKHTKPKSRETKKNKVLTKTIYETLSQETKKQEVSRNKKKICMAVQKKNETKYGG